MSQFSESYHLRSERQEDACELLERAGLAGYIFPMVADWVSFVAENGRFEPDRRIVAAAGHPLLHYVCVEDSGWSFALFEGGQVVSAYRCQWEEGISWEEGRYSRAEIERLVPEVSAALLDDFEGWLHPTDWDEVMGANPAGLFARALGLEYYDFVAYRSVARDFAEAANEFQHVIKVRG